ncbi:MAG TPA: endonuclease Q family protein [Methanoregulaceae archaeon]|nr:endonuclease Q family protein [Methanoregulaceae archaeon]
MDLNCDLHLHSPFARGVSRRMTPEGLLAASAQKGIEVIGTGDALQSEWRKAWRPHLENDLGIVVLPTVEVQAEGRVHHLAFFPDFDAAEAFGALLSPHGNSLTTEGRPHVHLSGGEVVRAAHEAGGLAGPSHAFTPWTGIYAAFDSIAACYGGEPIDFLELGLSADSSYGAGITELYKVPFISASDAHSPELHRLGREFTRIGVDRPTPAGVLDALKRGRVVMNVGLFPEEGKYNETACMRCIHHYSLAEAEEHGWRCPEDGTPLKKGVHDRARELSGGTPRPRPPYLHLIPLALVIAEVLGLGSPTAKGVRRVHEALLTAFSTEIAVLVDLPVDEIAAVDPAVARAIGALRAGRVVLHPGGGGCYGTFELPRD